MYNFWSGTIEYRFDFITNSFFNGTVQVTMTTGRRNATVPDIQSTFSKTFHLGEQESFTFTCPYISDTVMRRTSAAIYTNYAEPGSVAAANKAMTFNQNWALAPSTHNMIRVEVINPLRTIPNTVQEVDIMVFVRAVSDFCLHGLKQASAWPAASAPACSSSITSSCTC